ncbi:hypothetical protein LCGC14_2153660, partial [marine sediment metagenome]
IEVSRNLTKSHKDRLALLSRRKEGIAALPQFNFGSGSFRAEVVMVEYVYIELWTHPPNNKPRIGLDAAEALYQWLDEVLHGSDLGE